MPNGAAYCPKFGARMGEGGRVLPETRYERRRAELEARRRTDPIGAAGFGVFLIVVAVIYINFPGVFGGFIDWLSSWADTGPTMLPTTLVEPVVWFFLGMGAWSIAAALIRGLSGMRTSAAVRDFFGGLANFGIAYVLREYAAGALTWITFIALFFIILGGSILLSGIVNSFMREPRYPKP